MKIYLYPEEERKAAQTGGFFVEAEPGSYWLGYIHDKTGDIHRSRIERDLFEAFVKQASVNTDKFHNSKT